MINRDKALKESAMCRAIVSATLGLAHEPMEFGELYGVVRNKLPKGYTPKRFEVCLRGMVKNGLVDTLGRRGHLKYVKAGIVDAPDKGVNKTKRAAKERLDIVVGKHGDYAELTLRGMTIRITVGE